MKKHISYADYSSLSDSACEIYFKWMVDKDYMTSITSKGVTGNFLMTINQMKEFLGKDWKEDGKYTDEQLCDALWQAVKNKLENE